MLYEVITTQATLQLIRAAQKSNFAACVEMAKLALIASTTGD